MASLELRNGMYRAVFRLEGSKYSRSLKTSNQKAAEASLARLEDNLHRLELGLIEIPQQGNVVDFLIGGQKQKSISKKKPIAKTVTIGRAWQIFQESVPDGSLEQSTLNGMKTHVAHPTKQSGSNAASAERLEQSQRVRDYSAKRKVTSESAGWAKGDLLIAKAVGNRS